MKKLVSLVLVLCMVMAVCACAFADEKPFAGQKLVVSNFSFNGELLQKNIYDPFMELTGAELVIETGNNAVRVTNLTEKPSAYDVVVIGDMFTKQMDQAGIIEHVDYSDLTNLSGIYEAARQPLGEGHGPAYGFNRLGIIVNAAYCPVEVTSFADLWKPELKGEIAIPEITNTSGPLFYYGVAAAFGLTPGQDDEAIFAKLAELKPNIVNTYTSANNTITMLNQGEISVAVLLDYSYTTAKNANPDYVWVDPVEGSFGGYNMLSILAGSQNVDLAKAFIDWYISYEVQYAEAIDGVDAPVRNDIVLTPEQSANFTYGEKIESLIFVDWDLVLANMENWIAAWNSTFAVQ